MTIVNKALNSRKKPFYKLNCGDVFIYCKEYYMVIEDIVDGEYTSVNNALCLNDFKVTEFPDDEEVIMINAELVVDY